MHHQKRNGRETEEFFLGKFCGSKVDTPPNSVLVFSNTPEVTVIMAMAVEGSTIAVCSRVVAGAGVAVT